ncbi:MAG TPA: 50S ribosomal protein L23 [Candidatus Nanoarchaeia archaeon]|nr:50S ribosomal protein L23 [Candidatus Nanoarchaeia archaeon]
MDPYRIIRYPLATEKSVRTMEMENKLILIVHLKSNKQQIKEAVEQAFSVKVVKVNTLITSTGLKKAYVKLSTDTPAIDVATQLGLI